MQQRSARYCAFLSPVPCNSPVRMPVVSSRAAPWRHLRKVRGRFSEIHFGCRRGQAGDVRHHQRAIRASLGTSQECVVNALHTGLSADSPALWRKEEPLNSGPFRVSVTAENIGPVERAQFGNTLLRQHVSLLGTNSRRFPRQRPRSRSPADTPCRRENRPRRA